MFAQSKEVNRLDPNKFNEKSAYELAKKQKTDPSEIKGYIQFLKADFSSKQALEKLIHKHTPYENNSPSVQETIIYIEPNKPMSLGCPNMAFEQYNFNGWTGSIGKTYTISGGTTPGYSITGTNIVNAAGDNVSLVNTSNYHTIMTIPATNPIYPNCYGYDSIACRAVGSQSISQIPFVSPFSFDPVSVRLNGALANNRACRLKYITTASSSNQRLSYSYALVFHDPTAGLTPHTAGEAPYFKVTVKNETTNTEIPGCSSYTFNPIGAQPSDSLMISTTSNPTEVPVLYRKWNYYTVDLSSLAPGTLVSINFEVGGCAKLNGSHYSYAYVDAECGGIGNTYSNMCSGSAFATLIAPTGFNSYQWVSPSGVVNGINNDTLIVNPATVGSTYTVNMISPGGCAISQTVSIGLTTVNIINLNATSSCAGGNSGTASVLANGSNSAYTYSWTNLSSGSIVSTSQTATGLAPGNYNVLVSSATCGQQSNNFSIGVSPPVFYSQLKPYCGNAVSIIQPQGSNYIWYHNNAMIPAPIGTNDTLIINKPTSGDIYTVVYHNLSGCKDSIAYSLSEVVGGNYYFSNVTNSCPGNNNGSIQLNINTPYTSAPYNYIVNGPSNTVITNTTTTASSLSISSLAAGSYTTTINDGVCIYKNTFIINKIQTSFSVTPTQSVLCFPDPVSINFNYGSTLPINCGLDTNLCTGEPTSLFTAGTFTQNAYNSYPAAYGNYWTHGRSQYLVRKTELNGAGIFAGKISSLAFNVLNLNATAINYPNFSINMGCTSLNALPNVTTIAQPFITGLQTVYTNPNQPVSLGWLTHYFNQPFMWDGNSNIIIEVCFSFPDPIGFGNFSENVSLQLKQMPYVANMYHVEDAAPVCGGAQPADNGNGTLMTNGVNMLPNMKFGYCGIIPSKNSYTISTSANGTITTNFSNDSIVVSPTFVTPPTPPGAVIYTISVKNPIGNCISTKTLQILYPPLSPTITSMASKDTICQNGSTTLSAFGAFDYNWYYLQGTNQTPISTNSVVTVNPPSIGNNMYMVIGSAPCPSSVADTNIIMIDVIQKTDLTITPLADITKCLNKYCQFTTNIGSTIISNLGKPYTYAWTTIPGNNPAPGINNNSSYTTNTNSTTTLVVTVNGNCANSISDTVTIKNFIDDLSIHITDTSTTCSGTPYTLNSITTGGYPNYHYAWLISPNTTTLSTNSSFTSVSPDVEGTYTVVVNVNDSCGYQKTDYEVIVVLPPCNVTIPNVITPNGDNTNDFFKIKNLEHHPNTKVTIFDRWGLKVYENTNYNNEWKADNVADGTFFYIIEVVDDKKYSGFITVLKGK